MTGVELPFLGQDEWEFQMLLNEFHRLEISSFLEIGSLQGGVLARVRVEFPYINMVSIDPAPNITYNMRLFHQVLGSSQDEQSRASAYAYNGNKNFDAVFVDGDHNYEMVRQDWRMYSVIANKLIAFHDIHHTWDERITVEKLWNELKADPNLKTGTLYGHGNDPTGIGIVYL